MKTKTTKTAVALLLMCQSISAQHYDSNVDQYCRHINSHPSSCRIDQSWEGSIYGGLMMSSVSGEALGQSCSLGGLDIGASATYLWGRTCWPIFLEFNGYLDLKGATYISSEESDCEYTDYAVQLTLTPGIRINRFSIDCGPYIAYSAFSDVQDDQFLSPNVSGTEFGIRVGCALRFKRFYLSCTMIWGSRIRTSNSRRMI